MKTCKIKNHVYAVTLPINEKKQDDLLGMYILSSLEDATDAVLSLFNDNTYRLYSPYKETQRGIMTDDIIFGDKLITVH